MYIPDELKSDVANFWASAAGRFLVEAAKARLPLCPNSKSDLHTIAVEYAIREGAENMLKEIQIIHTEENPTPKAKSETITEEMRQALFDPRD